MQRAAKALSTSSRAAVPGTSPKPSSATLLNGEPSSAKHARPPAIGITNAVVSVLRRAAASLAGR
jgi:hypothetical protein